MSKTKWVPGPHTVIDGADAANVGRRVVAGGRVVAQCECLSTETNQANAQLFAAAEDLYFRVAAHTGGCGACGGTSTPNRMSAMDDSRAPDGSCSVCYEDRRVMAKARGETS